VGIIIRHNFRLLAAPSAIGIRNYLAPKPPAPQQYGAHRTAAEATRDSIPTLQLFTFSRKSLLRTVSITIPTKDPPLVPPRSGSLGTPSTSCSFPSLLFFFFFDTFVRRLNSVCSTSEPPPSPFYASSASTVIYPVIRLDKRAHQHGRWQEKGRFRYRAR
jgi:hypothetical protein